MVGTVFILGVNRFCTNRVWDGTPQKTLSPNEPPKAVRRSKTYIFLICTKPISVKYMSFENTGFVNLNGRNETI